MDNCQLDGSMMLNDSSDKDIPIDILVDVDLPWIDLVSWGF